MTDVLDELTKLCDAATPGPWEWVGTDIMFAHKEWVIQSEFTVVDDDQFELEPAIGDDDAAFIIAARTYLSLLVEVARAARNIDLWWDDFYCVGCGCCYKEDHCQHGDACAAVNLDAALRALEAGAEK